MIPIYKIIDGVRVLCNKTILNDVVNEEIYGSKFCKPSLHDVLRPYIKRFYDEEGRVIRTRGRQDSKRLAEKIMNIFFRKLKKDLFENFNFFEFPDKHVKMIGIKMTERFNPATLNRSFSGFIETSEKFKSDIGGEYLFVPSRVVRRKLRKTITV